MFTFQNEDFGEFIQKSMSKHNVITFDTIEFAKSM
jgi:hypothetical protein